MKVQFVNSHGTVGTIHDDMTIESEGPVSSDTHRFVKRIKDNSKPPVSIEDRSPEFLINLFVQTSVQKVEVVPKSKPIPPLIPAQL